jgi:hypothetical protein
MSFGFLIWAVLMGGVVFLAFAATRLGEKEPQKGFRDTGLAILEFGRAFPREAIRQLHATADGKVVFVRLHDNKAGYMRSQRGHYSCHLIEPGMAQASPTPDARGLVIDFVDAPHQSGTFLFEKPEEAAEVALWLLGNFVQGGERGESESSSSLS